MDKQYYDDPVRDKAYWDDASYADREFADEDDVPGENQCKQKKSPERKRREEAFTALYNAYMHPTEKLSAFRIQCQQDDLFTLLCQLNSGWAYRKTAGYISAGFTRANAEDALYIGCYYAHSKLLDDKAAGNYIDYPVAHYLRLAQNKTIDAYFRKEFGRLSRKSKTLGETPEAEQTEEHRHRKEPYTISIDAMRQDSDGNYHNDRNRELSYAPFACARRPEEERRKMANQLSELFLTELLNYNREPQKPLAVMYGNILFQLAKVRGNDDLSLAAKASTKVYSPSWAHARMGRRNLVELGDFSERLLFRFFSSPMLWGPVFRQHLQQPGPAGEGLWADIIYTENYSEKQTSDWMESITKTINQKCARQMAQNREMVEYVEETFSYRNKFRKALAKFEKETER